MFLKAMLGLGKKPSAKQLEYASSLIKSAPVVLATRTWCPHCKTAEATIKEYPVKANVIQLNHRGK